jgi:hypothetical protein
VPRCDVCPLQGECPSRGRRFEPTRKQKPFDGSFRQRRARVLRLVAEQAQSVQIDPEAVAALHRDGLVQVDSGLVSLPR